MTTPAPPPSTPPTPPAGRGLLAGKSVLVTAAAGTGIGFATAKRCAEEGARVAIADIHERRLGEARDALTEVLGEAPPAVLANVTNEDDVQRLFAAAVDAFGSVDVVVNNAGLGGTANLVDMTDEQWSNVLDVTLTGTMRMTRARSRTCSRAAVASWSTTRRSSAGGPKPDSATTPQPKPA